MIDSGLLEPEAPPSQGAPALGGGPRLIFQATEGQIQVLTGRSRFTSVCASRRWGKSTCGQLALAQKAAKYRSEKTMWWVGPTYRQVKKPYRKMVQLLTQMNLVKSVSRSELVIDLVTGVRLEFRSADVPDNLRGDGVKFMVVDEPSMMPEPVWAECLRPTLADSNGDAVFLYTPKGKAHWTYRLYIRGLDEVRDTGAYRTFRFGVEDAVFIPATEVEQARQDMPKRAFDQEFNALFLEGSGVVFEDINGRLWTGALGLPAGHGVAIGVDWAKKHDWTVFWAMDADTGLALEVLRFQKLSYVRQVELLKDFAQKWHDRSRGALAGCFDQTGVGEGVGDIMAEASLPGVWEGLTFTNQTKKVLVEEGIVAWDSGKLWWPSDWESQPAMRRAMHEHELFSLNVTPGGNVQYSAPDGEHDDCVVAGLLANRARRQLHVKVIRRMPVYFG